MITQCFDNEMKQLNGQKYNVFIEKIGCNVRYPQIRNNDCTLLIIDTPPPVGEYC